MIYRKLIENRIKEAIGLLVIYTSRRALIKEFEKENVYWFVKIIGEQVTPLGFYRFSEGSAYVIEGPTGSHYLGAGEKWPIRLGRYFIEGFIPVDEGKRKQMISQDWEPPLLNKLDKERMHIA